LILLDTHAWIWWLSGDESLSQGARAAIEPAIAEHALFVSSISVWELALLVSKGRLQLSVDVRRWVRTAEALPFLTFLPIDNQIALRSVELGPALHADPADRMIVATALLQGLSLVSKDERLRAAGLVPVIW
jgi:PIN domain nuclease of toxin-antitoxin system